MTDTLHTPNNDAPTTYVPPGDRPEGHEFWERSPYDAADYGPVSDFAKRAAVPEVIVRVFSIEGHRLFTFTIGGFKLFKNKEHTAMQVVRLGGGGGGLRKGLK